MTLKNSFLARLMENAKRRIWLLVVSILAFVVAIPTYTAMYLSVISQREILIEQNRVKDSMYEFATGMYSGSNVLIFIMVGAFAVACGIQGFSYLYDRNKIDFYNSKPVKAVTRFFSIWTNGIILFLVPYIIGTLINLVLFAANGILDVKLFSVVWLYFVLALGLYLCMYHLAILALMMTGKLIVTCMGILVFLLYEVCIRYLAFVFFDYFYQFFYVADGTAWVLPALSPVSYLVPYAQGDWSIGTTLLCLLLFAAGVLGLAWWCYKKRPSELAGSAMTFFAIKPVIKIGIAVPVGLAAGIVTCSIVNYRPFSHKGSPAFPIFVGILGVLIACCFIQVIYEADIKGIFHKKIHVLISFVLALCIVLIFRYDLTGYDRRLPDAEDIEYASILTDTGNRYGNSYLDDEYKWLSKEEYVNKYMKLTGENADAVRNLAAHSIDLYLTQWNDNFEADYEYRYTVFTFHKKNGSVICREIPVPIREEKAVSYIKQIENAKEFIMGNERAMSEQLMNALNGNEYKVEATWGNYVANQELTRKQARELLELYRIDVMKDNYQIRSSELPLGELRLYIDMQVYYSRNMEFLIYPSYTNCIRYLEENGFETKEYVSVDDIEKINVIRYNESEGTETYYEEYGYGYYEKTVEENVSTSVTTSYNEPEKIQQIIDASYPGCLDYESWYISEPFEEYYTIRVFFKEDTQGYDNYGYELDFAFLKGEVPEFVTQDLLAEVSVTE